MSGQQRQRERWWRAGEGTEERNAATRLAGERQKKTKTKQTERERKKWNRGLRCRADRLAFRETAGAIRRPAGAGQHSVVFNQDQKAT